MALTDKLSAIGTAIRTKTGKTDPLTLYEMVTEIESIQTSEDVTAETNDYTAKIAQLESAVTALETELAGKASGGSGGANIETCTVIITSINGNFGDDSGTLLYTTVENGEIVVKRADGKMNNISISCICGSLLFVNEYVNRVDHSYSGLEPIKESGDYYPFCDHNLHPFIVTAAAGGTATLEIELG